MAAWYIGTGTASIMGGLVAYGLLFYSADTFRSWQLLFLIFGLVTVVVGIAVIAFLPDNPISSRLSHTEKICAIERLRENKTGIENKRFKKEQFREVFVDPQTYLIAVVVAAMDVPNAAGSSFSALIIQSFGFTTKQTELLSIPGGVIERRLHPGRKLHRGEDQPAVCGGHRQLRHRSGGQLSDGLWQHPSHPAGRELPDELLGAGAATDVRAGRGQRGRTHEESDHERRPADGGQYPRAADFSHEGCTGVHAGQG